MELRSPTELDPYESLFLVLALGLAGIHLYLGLFAPFVAADRATQLLIIGVALLLGPVVFFTPYWRPLLYLLGATFAVNLGILWLLSGMEYFLYGVLTGIAAGGFVLLGFYLFWRDQFHVGGSE